VRLDAEERAMLAGEHGPIVQRMMRLLVRLGEVFGADHMVPVGSVQVSGVSYKSIGDPGLEFLEDVAAQNARVRVLTTLNPAGMDVERWQELGFPEDFAYKQKRILDAFAHMGVVGSPTCTPYLSGNVPRFGEHVAWAESSAVSYANSVIGARTNREGGPSALAAALTGRTPSHGLHRTSQRAPTVHVAVDASLTTADFGALGIHVGRTLAGVPYLTGLGNPTTEQLRQLGAAMAAAGSIGLYHVHGVTPEASIYSMPGRTVHVGRADIDAVRGELGGGGRPDIVILGCPHASLAELARIASLVEGRALRIPLWVCTSRATRDSAPGLVAAIERAGGRVIADTCMVVSPLESMGPRTTAVSSAKAAHYLPGFCNQSVVFDDVERLVEEALG
jgi:predicted aconitase